MAVLVALGLVMVLAASPVISLATYGSAWHIFMEQCIWAALGTAALLVTVKVDYHRWRRLWLLAPAGTIVLLMAVLVPGVGKRVGGSSRWLGAGMVRIQPSELSKFALVLFAAAILSYWEDRGDVERALRPLILVFGCMAGLVILQPDMGTTMVLVAILLGMLLCAGIRASRIAKLVGIISAAAVLAALADPYRRERVLSFVNPWAHASGSGYQVIQSLIGFGQGGALGVGIGAGSQKWGILPNAHTDFIFSIVGEQLGLVGSCAVIVAFVLFGLYGVKVAAHSPDRFGSLMAIGITWWIVSEAMVNMGAVIGLLPVTGIPLPFISYGGSSLVIDFAAVGILINVAKSHAAKSHAAKSNAAKNMAGGGVSGGFAAGHRRMRGGSGRETLSPSPARRRERLTAARSRQLPGV